MADQHIGYPGSVNSAELAEWLPNVGGAQYSVEDPNHAKVITNAIGDRGVTIKAGTVIGDGIMDVFENDTTLNFASVASGNRWDMIVLRRTWNATIGASTSIYTIIQGNANKSLPARNNNKGVIADQPIALCRVRAGFSSVQEIVDLRCWAHNGGVYAKDDLVRSYIDQPGTHLTIGNESWIRRVTNGATSDSESWLKVGSLTSFNMFDRGISLTPGAPANAFLMQGGTQVTTTDQAGYARITWPTPFPNGLLTVIGMNGDEFASGATFFSSAGGTIFGSSGAGNKNDWVYCLLAENSNGNLIKQPHRLHRINWIAIGW